LKEAWPHNRHNEIATDGLIVNSQLPCFYKIGGNMRFEHIRIATEGAIGTITVDRQEVLNAVTRKSVTELAAAVDMLMADKKIRALILTGAGDRAFIAGGDINDEVLMNSAESIAFSEQGHKLTAAIEGGAKPVIAAINGYALGGGCELILACDFRLAAENAFFGLPEIKLGVTCGWGGTTRLPRLVGKTKAKEMLMLGEMIDAAEAYRIGLVNTVVPQAELLTEARKWGEALSRFSAYPLAMSKHLVDWGMEIDFAKAAQLETFVFGMAGTKEDKFEGMRAFIEKRPPRFEDK
jgi:enoyl-CoA hydratase